MILVQKQPQALLPTMSNIAHSHRRHPSAPPAVIVQPTKTPGLLSLSKPARPSTPRSHVQPSRQQRAAPRAKATLSQAQRSPAQAKHQPKDADKKPAGLVKPASDAVAAPNAQFKAAALQTPDKNSRGRSHAKPPKDKGSRRSASQSTVRNSARRQNQTHHHQPSPPAPDVIPSQAEVAQLSGLPSLPKANVNSFDPFLASDDSDTAGSESITPSARSVTPAKQAGAPRIPKLNERPSGRLARRRVPAGRAESPTPSRAKVKAVPVPRAGTPLKSERESAAMQLSRSDPVLSNMIERPAAKRFATASSLSSSSSGLPEWDSFPVCDDTDNASDSTTAPSTPIREAATWQQLALADEGPRTAPLNSASGWPFNDVFKVDLPFTPPRRQRPRYHQRAPSEGVFHMSSDDEAPSTAQLASKSMSSLLKRQSLPTHKAGLKRNFWQQEEEKAPFFASSMFQNSPSPEDLPAPTFGARF